NYLAYRLSDGSLYKAGHTYGVLLHDINVDPNGGPVGPDPEFSAMLAPTPPQDAALAAAYTKYQPLRDYLASNPDAGPKPPAANTIINAAVFTIGHATTEITNLAAAVQPLAAPVPKGWIKCGSGAPSPCPDVTGARACDAMQDSSFDELQALVPLP